MEDYAWQTIKRSKNCSNWWRKVINLHKTHLCVVNILRRIGRRDMTHKYVINKKRISWKFTVPSNFTPFYVYLQYNKKCLFRFCLNSIEDATPGTPYLQIYSESLWWKSKGNYLKIKVSWRTKNILVLILKFMVRLS